MQNKDISSSLNIMYRSNSDLDSIIEAVAFTELECSINVRPHNRAQGRFELIEAPRITVDLKPIGDATTRSRIDLQTINYGDTQRMMIGHDTIEEFESFVNFGDLNVAIPDLLYLEDAKLRLYYTGTIKAKANIEIYQPNTVWREYGITYANKPRSTELLADQYFVNTTEKYVEFDVLDVLKQWQGGSLNNYGFNIRSNDDTPIYFNTRESSKPPILQVRYITSAVQSYGRAEMESELFIYQRGYKDLNSSLTVKSDRGLNYLDSSIYVHRYEDPLFNDFSSSLVISHPDLYSSLTVGIRVEDDLDSYITIIESKITDLGTMLTSSRPDLASMITVDPKISLISEISIANRVNDDLTSSIVFSNPDLSSFIEISNYTHARSDMDSELSVRNEYYEDLDSSITISKPETSGFLVIRGSAYSDLDGTLDIPTFHFQDGTISVSRPDIDGYFMVKEVGYSDLGSFIDVPAFDDLNSDVAISRPDLYSMLEVKYVSDQDGTIYIKDRVYLDSSIDIRQFSDLDSTILVKQFTDIESEMIISKPELGGFLYPRVVGLYDIDGLVSIRKRDVSDMNSTLIIKGASSGAYYYIL